MILRLAASSVLIAILLTSLPAASGAQATPAQADVAASQAAGNSRPDPESSSAATAPLAPAGSPRGDVVIAEVANGGPLNAADSFFELKNLGNRPVDLTGWSVYRCNEFGLRRNRGNPEVDLTGVVLPPGGIFTVARVGAHLGAGVAVDAVTTNPFAAAGFGLDLEDPDGRRVDAVAVYPNEPWPMLSECSVGENLPNTLNYSAGESWQRVTDTGSPAADFVLAQATPGAENRTSARRAPARDTVLIDELTAAGPAGAGDDFVELRNSSADAVDLSGWRLYRCTASGRLSDRTLQLTFHDGAVLAAGARLIVGGPGYSRPVVHRTAESLADGTFGVLLESADGVVQDRVAVSEYADSACQDGDRKLPSVLDYASGESYQRVATSGDPERDFVVAARTPGQRNASSDDGLFDPAFAYPDTPAVAISEFATDPAGSALPDGAGQRNFVELGNYGAAAVDLSGWTIHRCTVSGRRALSPQVVIDSGTVLQPGRTFLAAREGTAQADAADAVYPVSFNFLGSGVWLSDDRGQRVDSVGAYQANEMDRLNEATSPCTKRESLVTYRPDRLRGETYQRSRFTGVDHDDFIVTEATPGRIDRHRWEDPTAVEAAALRPVGLPEPPILAADRADEAPAAAESLANAVVAAFAGVSDGPLQRYRLPGERRLAPGDLDHAVTDDRWGRPYQRIVLDAAALEPGETVVWSGSTAGRNELSLSVWNSGAKRWRELDRRSPADGEDLTLAGVLRRTDLDGTVTLLVQDVPRARSPFSGEPDGGFADPVGYDFAISHMTDTQYLSESYPEVYAEMVAWIVANAPARKIEFVSHTGDLVQNWVDPDQNTARALREFERASTIQALLDDSGVPNSVLPGNHDSKRGLDPSLFNSYFGPERYADRPWYGGSISEDDNSANFSTFEAAGTRFLMLALPYAYGEAEIAWAERIVEAHPEHNVVLSTHEHLTPKTRFEPAHRSDTSRWVSRATSLWERVVAPNRNVVAVLSGHFHGIGQVVTEDAGGLPGHTVVELLADYQEFRTHTGERATGFQRLLQFDMASGSVAVDTFSARLDATSSAGYDYAQFTPDNGRPESASNARPWRILEAGLQHRYTAADDEFSVRLNLMHPKSVATAGLGVAENAAASGAWKSLTAGF